MNRIDEILDDVLPKLRIASGPDSHGEYTTWCPFHPDGQGTPPHRPNLKVSARGYVCHACGEKGGLKNLASRLGSAGILPAGSASVSLASGECRQDAGGTSYDYRDERGTLLFQAVRKPGKRFTQRRPVGDGWEYDLKGVRRVLYRLPELIARPHDPVYIVEGEKDADRLMRLGLLATTNSGGAGKWRREYDDVLADRDVVIIPDNDEPGMKHAEGVARALHGIARSVKIVNLPGLPPKGDVSDWMASGHTVEELKAVVDERSTLNVPRISTDDCSLFTDHWPSPPSDAAYYGLAGDIIRAIEPHTEADPMALLTSFFAAYGNAIGRNAHFSAEADRHFMNLFIAHVGSTAKGRKGTSWGQVLKLMTATDADWVSARILSGLSSGEGLIWAVRDPIERQEAVREGKKIVGYQPVIVDEGVVDKRALVVEGEFASALRVIGREGNTLSAVIRNAWDTGNLNSLTKNSQAKATGAHISIIGHITKDELLRYLGSTEAGNGFANRFLWVCVRRSKILPEGGSLTDDALAPLVKSLSLAIEHGRQEMEMVRDDEARELWCEVYPELSEGKPGLLGAVTARAEAQVMRLACIYALLDLSYVVRREHLEAGLAVWKYADDSARFIFGESLGDPLADEILKALRNAPDGMTRTEIIHCVGHSVTATDLNGALGCLASASLIRGEQDASTGGRKAYRWLAVRPVADGNARKEVSKSAPKALTYFLPAGSDEDAEWGEV